MSLPDAALTVLRELHAVRRSLAADCAIDPAHRNVLQARERLLKRCVDSMYGPTGVDARRPAAVVSSEGVRTILEVRAYLEDATTKAFGVIATTVDADVSPRPCSSSSSSV
jgi:hypothetical protein